MLKRWLARLLCLPGILTATGASAGTISVRFPDVGSSVTAGQEYVISVTVVADGTEVLPSGSAISFLMEWNPATLAPRDAPGRSTQIVTVGPGAGGAQMTGTFTGSGASASLDGAASIDCAVGAFRCPVVSQQAPIGDPAIALDAQTLVGTLVLEGVASGPADFRIARLGDAAGQMQLVVIPEPSTPVLLGLGLAPLARRGRWRGTRH